MIEKSKSIPFKGALIGGKWILQKNGKKWLSRNPFNLNQTVIEWIEDSMLVDQAVHASELAFQGWQKLSFEERARHLRQFKEALLKRSSEIENTIVAEAGKARWEAKQEVAALGNKIDITLECMPRLMKSISEISGNEAQIEWKPRGICAVIGPFNFPVHLANGHIIPALLAGNSVIFKPSEFTVACAQVYAEAALEAEIPLELLPGSADTAVPLISSPQVKGVFFTGSYRTGRRIIETLLEARSDLATLAALEMGGKNATIVTADADLKKAAFETLMSAYATAGQRCSSTSRLLVEEAIYPKFLKNLLELIRQLPFGDPSLPETFMGPMIHENARDQFFKFLKNARREGYECLIESEILSDKSCLVSPSLYECHQIEKILNSSSWNEEFFGPNILATTFKNRDELKELHESPPYGLVTSVFSKNEEFFNWCKTEFTIGLCHWNRGTIGASSRLPFGGTKRSGNNWPAGLFSFFYCSEPQGILKDLNPFQIEKLPQPLQKLVHP